MICYCILCIGIPFLRGCNELLRFKIIFEFVVENKRFPGVGEVEPNMPAHPPLYYFLLTPVIVFSNLINQNVMLMLELSSIIIFQFMLNFKAFSFFFRQSLLHG